MRFLDLCSVCAIEVLNAILVILVVVVAVVVCEVPIAPSDASNAFHGNNNNDFYNIHDYRNEQHNNIHIRKLTTKNNHNNNSNNNKMFNMTIITANWQPQPQSSSSKVPIAAEMQRTTKLKQKMPQTTNTAKYNNNTWNNHNKYSSKGMTTVSATKWFLPASFSKPFSQLAAFFGGGSGGGNGGDLSDYHFLFNAERHTVFQLHTTSSINNNYNNIKRRAATSTAATKASHPSYRASKDMHKRSFTKRKTSTGTNVTTTTTTSRIIRTPTGIQQQPAVGIAGRDGAGIGGEQRAYQFVGNSIGSAIGVHSKDASSSSSSSSSLPSLSPPAATTTATATAAIASANAVVRMEEVQLYNATSLRQSHFNPFNPTRIIIHGWFGGLHAGVFQSLVPEYMRLGRGNYNVFTVDWGRGAIADYLTASYRVKPVGKALAKFIDFLHAEAGMRFEDLQLIGFSMGAHIAGIAGKHVQTGQVPVIYALDPALPFFRYDAYDERLSITDAAYVEVIHTNAGTYGYDWPLGHVDFYVNYGQQQPGCFLNECSHMRAYQLFAESLRQPFRGTGCDVQQWAYMMRYRRCPAPTGLTMYMGGDDKDVLRLRGRGGVYNVDTNAVPPYAR